MQPLIVICTGHIEEEFIKKAWSVKADEVISKPIDQALLKNIFEEIIDIWGKDST